MRWRLQAWHSLILVLVLLPLDLVSEFYNADYDEIAVSWKVVYGVTWLLAWVVACSPTCCMD